MLHRYITFIVVIIGLFCCHATIVMAETDALAQLKKAKTEHQKKVAKASASYEAVLMAEIKKIAATGDLDAVKVVLVDHDRFKAKGTAPVNDQFKPAFKEYQTLKTAADLELLSIYDKTVQSLTKALKFKEAQQVQREMLAFRARANLPKEEAVKQVSEKLKILEARYGAGTKQVDVRKRLIGLIQDHRLSVKVSNATMGGDPAPAARKQLYVKAEINGKVEEFNVNEDELFTLDAIDPVARKKESLIVVKATFGEEKLKVDVKEKLAAMIKDGRLDLKVTAEAFGLKAEDYLLPGQSLQVEFKVNDKVQRYQCYIGQRLILDGAEDSNVEIQGIQPDTRQGKSVDLTPYLEDENHWRVRYFSSRGWRLIDGKGWKNLPRYANDELNLQKRYAESGHPEIFLLDYLFPRNFKLEFEIQSAQYIGMMDLLNTGDAQPVSVREKDWVKVSISSYNGHCVYLINGKHATPTRNNPTKYGYRVLYFDIPNGPKVRVRNFKYTEFADQYPFRETLTKAQQATIEESGIAVLHAVWGRTNAEWDATERVQQLMTAAGLSVPLTPMVIGENPFHGQEWLRLVYYKEGKLHYEVFQQGIASIDATKDKLAQADKRGIRNEPGIGHYAYLSLEQRAVLLKYGMVVLEAYWSDHRRVDITKRVNEFVNEDGLRVNLSGDFTGPHPRYGGTKTLELILLVGDQLIRKSYRQGEFKGEDWIRTKPLYIQPLRFAATGMVYQYRLRPETVDYVSQTLISGPEGMTLNDAGVLSWQPKASQLGQHEVAIQLQAGKFRSTLEFELTCIDQNELKPFKGDIAKYAEAQYWDLPSAQDYQISHDHKNAYLLSGDQLYVLEENGINIVKRMQLPKAYDLIRDREEYYLLISREEKVLDIVDKGSLKIIRSIALRYTKIHDLALHPHLPISYVAVRIQNAETKRQIFMINELNAEVWRQPELKGMGVAVSPDGQYLISSFMAIHTDGMETVERNGKKIQQPKYRSEDWLIYSRLDERGEPSTESVLKQVGKNGHGLALSADGHSAIYLCFTGYPGSGQLSAFAMNQPKKQPVIFPVGQYGGDTKRGRFHPYLPYFMSIGDKQVMLYSGKDGSPVDKQFSFEPLEQGKIQQAWFSPDGEWVMVPVVIDAATTRLKRFPIKLNEQERELIKAARKRIPEMRNIPEKLVDQQPSIPTIPQPDKQPPQPSPNRPSEGRFRKITHHIKEASAIEALVPRDLSGNTLAQNKKLYQGSVVLLKAKGKGMTLGSGIVVGSEGYILTNAHIVSSHAEIEVTYSSPQVSASTYGTVPAEWVSFDPDRNFALLKITPDRPLVYASFPGSNHINRGTEIRSFANLQGQGNAMRIRILTGKVADPRSVILDRSFIEMTAPAERAIDGATVFDAKGNLIGMVSFKARLRGRVFAVSYRQMSQYLEDKIKAGKRHHQGNPKQ